MTQTTFIQCDFCDSREPQWRYPCESFTVMLTFVHTNGDLLTVPWASNGDWAACNFCSELIEQEKWRELAGHGCATNPALQLFKQFLIEEKLVDAVMEMHKNFITLRQERQAI